MRKPIEIILYVEPFCPYCNYVQKFILRDIQIRRDELNRKLIREGLPPIPPIEIRVIDINANDGSIHSRWYEWYSKKVGSRSTPIVKIGNKIFYLWREKPDVLKEKELSKAEVLKAQIINELIDIGRRAEERERYDFDFRPHPRVSRMRRWGLEIYPY